MANEEQLAILKRGVKVWNEWRKNNNAYIDLSEAILTNRVLDGANLADAKLIGTDLSRSTLNGALLNHADLRGATLNGTHLNNADLRSANLTGANLRGAYLRGAFLNEANLTEAILFKTQLNGADLSNCRVCGISAWKLNLEGAIQTDLLVSDYGESTLTVDNLEIAQFISLISENQKLREVIDTIGKKAVLILGRFTDERKAVLEAIREELRKRDYIPILFDFEKPSSRTLTETMLTLAHLSRFVIADLTDPSSIPYELAKIVPQLRSVAIQPIILKGEHPFSMFQDLEDDRGIVLPPHEYETPDQLIAELSAKVIEPSEAKVNQLRPMK